MPNNEYEYSEKIHATIINPYFSNDDFNINCDLIRRFNIKNISTSLFYLKYLKETFNQSKVNIRTFISYPLSDLPIHCLSDLVTYAKDLGANGIEYSPKFFLLSKNNDDSFACEIERISSSGIPITLIFNNQRLNKELLNRAIQIAIELGIKNFQFGDGFGSQLDFEGITEMINLLNKNHSIKIVGGIKSLKQANNLFDAGIDCIGLSNFYDIFQEIKSN